MTEQPTREQLLHLADRARRGVALPAEHDALHQGIVALYADRDRQVDAKVGLLGQLGNALADKVAAEADHARVQERACLLAERLRKAERAADLLAGSHRRAEQVAVAVERVREVLADPLLHTADRERQGERCLARQIRAALDEPQPSTTTEACTCKHPIGEHGIYGCADGCGCEWMPKRNATKQPSPTA